MGEVRGRGFEDAQALAPSLVCLHPQPQCCRHLAAGNPACCCPSAHLELLLRPGVIATPTAQLHGYLWLGGVGGKGAAWTDGPVPDMVCSTVGNSLAPSWGPGIFSHSHLHCPTPPEQQQETGEAGISQTG